jgi:molecular chaperone Hsp33
MLRTSKLISFLDEKNNFQVRFLEGQKLINDLALIHDVKNQGFAFFRELILTNIHLISTLKNNEGLGLFIDSNEPYFRFKLECSENGNMRTLLFPADLDLFPEKINGELRFSKLFQGRSAPYTSIISLENEATSSVTNTFLKESHQANAKIFLTEQSDQSLYLAKLPKRTMDTTEDISLDEYWVNISNSIDKLFMEAHSESDKIISSMKSLGLTHLQTKEIKFSCPCSEEKMTQGIWSLIKTESLEEVFLDKQELEIRCDYCKTNYVLSKNIFKN